ncbi:energy transducer TonB family protein [Herbaspirillum chlorophenolicum]|uniref:energy transducer TonB family protein n=1 Tax=Herbaspirillum chlorophenolicum TaxID=211589 RepID=UPI000A3DF7E6|nr:energy transducer TonB [Herbaspirillum chlorophenolicum]
MKLSSANNDALSYSTQASGVRRRWSGIAIGAVLLAAVAALVWYLLSDVASTKREVSSPPMLMLPPPPPPPPEPEKLPEPTPEKIKPEVAPEPKPSEQMESPKDDSPPSPSKDLGDPVTIDGAAQAGNDAFGIQAGRGGGMTGGGGGMGGSYGRYLGTALQQAFARDPRTRQLAFEDLRLDITLDADGKVTKAVLQQSTGNTKIDEALLAMVRDYKADERPPAAQRYPMHLSIRGRRP